VLPSVGSATFYCPTGSIFWKGKPILKSNLDYCKGCGVCALKYAPNTMPVVMENSRIVAEA